MSIQRANEKCESCSTWHLQLLTFGGKLPTERRNCRAETVSEPDSQRILQTKQARHSVLIGKSGYLNSPPPPVSSACEASTGARFVLGLPLLCRVRLIPRDDGHLWCLLQCAADGRPRVPGCTGTCRTSACLCRELGFAVSLAADRREQGEPRCPVTYLSGSEFCFLGQDLEDGFQVGVSSLAVDLGSLLVSPVLVCRGTELGVWEWGRAADVTAVSFVMKIRTEWHHWLNFKRRTFI